MDFLIGCIIGLIVSIVLFSIINYILKGRKLPKSAEQGIYNAVYFIQLKQYQKALDLLAATEAEYAMTPEVMCDLCVQRADAHKGLGQLSQAVDAYEVLYEALQECEGKLKRNDALLAEIKDCYTGSNREAEFEKWELLFDQNLLK